MARSSISRAVARPPLISVAGLVGRPIRLAEGRQIGHVSDIVVRWASDTYPPVSGLVSRIAGQRAFVPFARIIELGSERVELSSSVLDLRPFERRDGETLLMADVVDHQLVDINGVQVVRASDLYLAEIGARVRLVGVETGLVSLARRLGPARWRSRATPTRVIDWADIHPGGRGGAVRLDRANRELRRLRPSDLADLVESLGHAARAELVTTLDTDLAADVLEQMEDAPRVTVLRHLEPVLAASILEAMEPDEAVEALRNLPTREGTALLAAVGSETRSALEALLAHRPGTAGGMMTTALAIVPEDATVADAVERLRALRDHRADIDAILIVGEGGTLVDDVSLFELLLAPLDARLGGLVSEPFPVVLASDASIDEVVEAARSNRSRSLVVVDHGRRPIGRILLDDVLDGLGPSSPGAHAVLHHEVTAT